MNAIDNTVTMLTNATQHATEQVEIICDTIHRELNRCYVKLYYPDHHVAVIMFDYYKPNTLYYSYEIKRKFTVLHQTRRRKYTNIDSIIDKISKELSVNYDTTM